MRGGEEVREITEGKRGKRCGKNVQEKGRKGRGWKWGDGGG